MWCQGTGAGGEHENVVWDQVMKGFICHAEFGLFVVEVGKSLTVFSVFNF